MYLHENSTMVGLLFDIWVSWNHSLLLCMFVYVLFYVHMDSCQLVYTVHSVLTSNNFRKFLAVVVFVACEKGYTWTQPTLEF